MNIRQQQVVETLVRVRAFLEANPASGTLTYTSAREVLDDVIRRVRELAGAEHAGRDLSRIELGRLKDQKARLVDVFMRPIVTIARAQIDPGSDAGLPDGLRLPTLPVGPTKLIAACDGMIAAVRAQEALFVAHGMPADFLAQFTAARDALERVVGVRVTQVGTHVAAREALKVQLRRGRRAVDRLDAVVRASFRDRAEVLGAANLEKARRMCEAFDEDAAECRVAAE